MCVSNQDYLQSYPLCVDFHAQGAGDNDSNVTFFHPALKAGSNGHELVWGEVIEALALHLQEGVAQCS